MQLVDVLVRAHPGLFRGLHIHLVVGVGRAEHGQRQAERGSLVQVRPFTKFNPKSKFIQVDYEAPGALLIGDA